MKSFIQKSTIILAIAVAGLAAGASAATIGLGTTKDTLFDTTKWYASGGILGKVIVNHAIGLNADPLDANEQSMNSLEGFYDNYPGPMVPALWTYKADNGLRISKAKISIAIYPGSNLPNWAGIADSTGARIASVAYSDYYVPSAASYDAISVVYTDASHTEAGYAWYTLELNLPESAVSLIDGHTEIFNQISVGYWNGMWAPFVGTVELTVVPEPASLALLGLGTLALLRRRRA